MKKNLFIPLMLLISQIIAAQTTYVVNESFASGVPSSWTASGITANSNNDKTCVTMSSGAVLTTVVIGKAGSLSLSHRASGNGKTLTVEKSVDGGSWVEVGTCSPSSSSGWGSSSFSINEASANVKIRFVCSSATIYLTDIQIGQLPDPVITATTESVDLGVVFVDETSAIQELSVVGYYLGADISLAVSGSGFEVSSDGATFATSAIISKDVSMPASVYLRYTSPTTPAGDVSGALAINSTGADEVEVLLEAFSSATVPTILSSSNKLNFGYLLYAESSVAKEVTIEAKYLNAATGDLAIAAPAGYEVSQSATTGFATSISLSFTSNTLSSQSIYVRFVPTGDVHLTTFSGNLTLNGGGASQTISLVGIGVTSMDGISEHYYISPSGSDLTGDGSLLKPWYSLTKAIDGIEPGDSIHCRGGSYNFSETIRLVSSGAAAKRICVFAYQKDDGTYEEPVFDFSNQPYGASNRGILITGNYWYFYGIHITKAGDNGIKLQGSNCIIERCIFSYNGDTGIQLGFGHNFSDTFPGISKNDGTYCANNVVVDCDSYQNYDQDNFGSDADGFACKMHNGKQNWFIRCRAWNNSDDAWDLYETDYSVYIIECWGWHSGDASQHPVSGGSFQGNGNGIKMGGNGTGGSSQGKHEAWNCIAFNNSKTGSVKGFDQNSHKGGVKLVNCLAFNNGYDFMFEDSPSGGTNDFYNNVCLSNRIEINSASAVMQNNVAINNPEKGWQNAMNLSFTASDYTALSEDAAIQPRSEDGALPTSFGRLVYGSSLVDEGVDNLVTPLPVFLDQALVGNAMSLNQPVEGNGRDLGPYESSYSNASGIDEALTGELNVWFDVRGGSTTLNVQGIKSTVDLKQLKLYSSTGQLMVAISGNSLDEVVTNRFELNQSELDLGVYLVVFETAADNKVVKVSLF